VEPQREALVPDVAAAPFHVSPGERKFVRRLSFSPGFGELGNERLFVFRLAFNPNAWLGYEGTVGHNPGRSVHALFNTLNVILRYPMPWRIQPYGSVGYGMMLVFPGEVFNADPVTKNALAVGGGLELYVRDDLALRAEARHTTVLGGERDAGGTVAYDYGEVTVGLSFYRSLDDR
jgi:opacity protein-like surface antigen